MVVQIDPPRAVQSDSCQQDRTRDGESGEDRNQAGYGSGDNEGQANTVERSVHTARLGVLDE